MLLGCSASFIHGFASLSCSLGELLRLVFDFSVEAFEDGQDGVFELFLGIVVSVVERLESELVYGGCLICVVW